MGFVSEVWHGKRKNNCIYTRLIIWSAQVFSQVLVFVFLKPCKPIAVRLLDKPDTTGLSSALYTNPRHVNDKELLCPCLCPWKQVAEEDPDLCVQAVRDQEGTVPRPFSQLHPLCALPGHGLHHIRVHEAGPPPELVTQPKHQHETSNRPTSVLPQTRWLLLQLQHWEYFLTLYSSFYKFTANLRIQIEGLLIGMLGKCKRIVPY